MSKTRSKVLHVLALVAASQARPAFESEIRTGPPSGDITLALHPLPDAQGDRNNVGSSSTLRGASSIRLHNEMRNALIAVDITIGTPPQAFKVQLDTGSPALWVFGQHCYTCTTQTLYSESSQTFSSTWNWDYLAFGGGRVPVQFVRDVVRVGELNTPAEFTFGVAAAFEDGRGSSVMASGIDGILGFSLPVAGKPPPVWTAMSAAWPEKRFGLHIRREGETFKARRRGQPVSFDGGELTLGGINETLIEGPPIPLELREADGFWAATLDGVNVNGAAVALSTDVGILDSGDSYISFGSADYAAFVAALGAQPLSGDWDETGYSGMHALPCSALDGLHVAFVFGGHKIAVHTYDLVTPVGGVCVLANVNCVPHARGVLLGVPFLMNVYSVFGVEPPSLELYRLKEEFNPSWRLRITPDGAVVPPGHIRLGSVHVPSKLSFVLCLLTLAVLGGLFLIALFRLMRRRFRRHTACDRYSLLQRVPVMGGQARPQVRS